MRTGGADFLVYRTGACGVWVVSTVCGREVGRPSAVRLSRRFSMSYRDRARWLYRLVAGS